MSLKKKNRILKKNARGSDNNRHNNQTLFQEAGNLFEAGKKEQALKLFKKIIASEPNHAHALHLAGLLCNDKGLYSEAQAYVIRAIKNNPDQAVFHFTLGDTYHKTDQSDLAKKSFQKAIEIDPKSIISLVKIGDILQETSEFEASIVYYRKAIAISPSYVDAYCNLGNSLQKLQRIDEALSVYKEALAISPSYIAIYNNMGRLLNQIGQHEEAKQVFLKALSIDPKSLDTYVNLGNTLKTLLQIDEAIYVYQNAIAINPSYTNIYFRLGALLTQEHRYSEAIDIYEKVIDHNPTFFNVYLLLGVILQKINRAKDAVSYFEKAVSLQPENTEVIYLLGHALRKLNRNSEAKAAFEKVLKLDISNSGAQHMMDTLNHINTQKAPIDYIKRLFDGYAETYNTSMVDTLEYNVPKLIGEIGKTLPLTSNQNHILDLGCGTGLCGKWLVPFAKTLTGVDISTKMLEEAQKLNIYSELKESEILTYLDEQNSNTFDLITGLEVFNYFGKLQQVFKAVRRALKPRGVFLFTVESNELCSDEYLLELSGRYSHSKSYIENQIQRAGFLIISFESVKLRTENLNPLGGFIIAVRG